MTVGQMERAWKQWPERAMYELLTRGFVRVAGIGILRLRLVPASMVAGKMWPSRLLVKFRMSRNGKRLLKQMDEGGVVDLAALLPRRRG